jgi:two-component system nitrate/nitrite response regulator NarL
MHGVLLVDDHADFRTFARGLIITAGYAVLAEAVDGSGALRAAELHQPEIVVLDIRLPDMSGLDVARRMKAGPNPPVVILISSGDRREYEQVAREAGARGFIAKADLTPAALRALADRP